MALHKELSGSEVHTPFAFVYTNASARESAAGLTSVDEKKTALQTDNYSVWVLKSAIGPTWEPVTKDMLDTDILNAIKHVDGAGSGLDADTIRGKVPSELGGENALNTTRMTTITANENFIVPSDVTTVAIYLIGGGGGGGGGLWPFENGTSGEVSSFGDYATVTGGGGGAGDGGAKGVGGIGGVAEKGIMCHNGDSGSPNGGNGGRNLLLSQITDLSDHYGSGGDGAKTADGGGGGGGAGGGTFTFCRVSPNSSIWTIIGDGGAGGSKYGAKGNKGVCRVYY